jgi:hypothetical protein
LAGASVRQLNAAGGKAPVLSAELLHVAVGQDFECGIGVALEFDAALRALVREPVRRHKVRHKNVADLIAVLVVLNRIADLAGPENALPDSGRHC